MSGFSTASSSEVDPTLHLPRLLMLHGGGTTAEIFRMQSRVLLAHLKPYFRCVFTDGPFLCNPGPGMIPVYEQFGPFRRYLRWLPEHPPIDDDSAIEEVEYCMRSAMEEDDAKGATGEWVGMIGFSQGAKLAASVLYESQLRLDERDAELVSAGGMYGASEDFGTDDMVEGFAGGKWRFAVCLAGRAPLVSLSSRSSSRKYVVRAGSISEGFDFEAAGPPPVKERLRLPCLHVHGLKDHGLHLHEKLVATYTLPSSSKVLEWDGDHRVQIKRPDVEKTVQGILETARRAGLKV